MPYVVNQQPGPDDRPPADDDGDYARVGMLALAVVALLTLAALLYARQHPVAMWWPIIGAAALLVRDARRPRA